MFTVRERINKTVNTHRIPFLTDFVVTGQKKKVVMIFWQNHHLLCWSLVYLSPFSWSNSFFFQLLCNGILEGAVQLSGEVWSFWTHTTKYFCLSKSDTTLCYVQKGFPIKLITTPFSCEYQECSFNVAELLRTSVFHHLEPRTNW